MNNARHPLYSLVKNLGRRSQQLEGEKSTEEKVGFTVGGTLWLSTERPRVEGHRHCNATLQYLK